MSAFKEHYNTFVAKIELRDSGNESDVTFLSGKVLKVKNTEFRPSTQSDFAGNLDRFGLIGMELYPIRVGDHSHMLDKRGRIDEPEIFKAVVNGYNIDLSVMQDSKG